MSKRTSIKLVAALICLFVLTTVSVFTFRAWRRAGAEVYRTFASPDGRFQIVVYRIPSRFAMPGQGSDAPGFVQLCDARTGRVFRDCDVEMVQLTDQISWSPTNVDVHLLANWRLPP